MKTVLILGLIILNLIVVSAQIQDLSFRPDNRRRRCSVNLNNCPRGTVCIRPDIFCVRAPCPIARPTCQRITSCRDVECPFGTVCREGNRRPRCVRRIGQIGNSCPRGFFQIGNRRCISSRQCGQSERAFCNNIDGFRTGVCCSRSNISGQKPGRCPRRRGRGNDFTTCDVECISDNECRGRQKCCQLGCRRACVRPVRVDFF